MSETYAITTLDDMELDAVCGGFSFTVGNIPGTVTDSFNATVVTQKNYQSSSIWNKHNYGDVTNDVSQMAMNMNSITQSF
jgi:hypothetical protein